MNRLAKFTTAALTAAGIALAPAPAVAADGDDLAKIIAGLAVAGIVAKAIDDRKKRRKRAAEAVTAGDFGRFGDGGIRHDGRRTIEGRVRPYRDDDDRDGFPRFGHGYKRQSLPDRCLRTVETRRGERLAYGARCLNRNYRHADKLPRYCETAVRTPRGFRVVYGARCLARDGWRVARR